MNKSLKLVALVLAVLASAQTIVSYAEDWSRSDFQLSTQNDTLEVTIEEYLDSEIETDEKQVLIEKMARYIEESGAQEELLEEIDRLREANRMHQQRFKRRGGDPGI